MVGIMMMSAIVYALSAVVMSVRSIFQPSWSTIQGARTRLDAGVWGFCVSSHETQERICSSFYSVHFGVSAPPAFCSIYASFTTDQQSHSLSDLAYMLESTSDELAFFFDRTCSPLGPLTLALACLTVVVGACGFTCLVASLGNHDKTLEQQARAKTMIAAACGTTVSTCCCWVIQAEAIALADNGSFGAAWPMHILASAFFFISGGAIILGGLSPPLKVVPYSHSIQDEDASKKKIDSTEVSRTHPLSTDTSFRRPSVAAADNVNE